MGDKFMRCWFLHIVHWNVFSDQTNTQEKKRKMDY